MDKLVLELLLVILYNIFLLIIYEYISFSSLIIILLDFFCELELEESIPTSLNLQIELEINFVDNCTYNYICDLTVNPRLLGSNDEITDIITP